jgi:NADP-dependent 3-hydroxy acid dehydrogenase YdfG
MQNKNLSGKVAVITGASSGIGKAIAIHFANQGVMVSLGARRVDKLEELASQIKSSGGQVTLFATDVTQKETVEGLIRHTLDTFGKVWM